jgi:hypothetical protein
MTSTGKPCVDGSLNQENGAGLWVLALHSGLLHTFDLLLNNYLTTPVHMGTSRVACSTLRNMGRSCATSALPKLTRATLLDIPWDTLVFICPRSSEQFLRKQKFRFDLSLGFRV